jgi:hypothetical protein
MSARVVGNGSLVMLFQPVWFRCPEHRVCYGATARGHGLGMQTPVRSAMCRQDWGEGRLEVIVLMGPDQSGIASVIHANHPPATP